MGCGQHTSIDLPKSVILRCPGASCCSAQLGATRTLGEPLRQHNCITRGTAHGATDPASSPRGVLPQGQQTPQSRTLSARGVSASSAGAPRYDCSTRLWLQDWSCIDQGGVQYWLQGSRASRCSDNNIAPTKQSTSSAPCSGVGVGLLLAGKSALGVQHDESSGSCHVPARQSAGFCSATRGCQEGSGSCSARGICAGNSTGLVQTCSTASFLPVGDLRAQLALGQLADGVGARANVAGTSRFKFPSELFLGPNGRSWPSAVLQESSARGSVRTCSTRLLCLVASKNFVQLGLGLPSELFLGPNGRSWPSAVLQESSAR